MSIDSRCEHPCLWTVEALEELVFIKIGPDVSMRDRPLTLEHVEAGEYRLLTPQELKVEVGARDVGVAFDSLHTSQILFHLLRRHVHQIVELLDFVTHFFLNTAERLCSVLTSVG